MLQIFSLPLLEYANEALINMNRSDVTMVESVQRHFTKRLLPCDPYDTRLLRLGLEPLWFRRMIKDMSMAHKYIYGYIFSKDIFKLYDSSARNSQLRSNGIKISPPNVSEVKTKFITKRITNLWNSLPSDIVCENSNSTFKTNLKRYLLKSSQLLSSLNPL